MILLFAHDRYRPGGGTNDLVGTYDTLDEMYDAIPQVEYFDQNDDAQVYDTDARAVTITWERFEEPLVASPFVRDERMPADWYRSVERSDEETAAVCAAAGHPFAWSMGGTGPITQRCECGERRQTTCGWCGELWHEHKSDCPMRPGA